MSMKKFFTISLAACSLQAFAQTDSAIHTLDEVIVTANKFEQTLSSTGKVLTVITAEQLQRSGGKDIAQILQEQTGITVNGFTSNTGKDKSLYVRGAAAKYTTILVDGVPVFDPSDISGTLDLRFISPDQVERIEILKGSQSTLYGSNAVAGVINIITKKATQGMLHANGNLGYGTYNTLRAGAGLNGKNKFFGYSASYNYFNTDGISEAKDKTGNGNFDKDGFKQQNVNLALSVHISPAIQINPFIHYSKIEGGFDADAFTDDNASNYSGKLLNTGFYGQANYKTGSLHYNYAYTYTKRNFATQYYTYDPKGKFNSAELYIKQKLGADIKLIAGLNYQDFKLMSNEDTLNSIFSVYANGVYNKKGLEVETGLRYNKHNRYGNNLTYSFNPSYLINKSLKIFVNLSSGFRAPTVDELFGPFGANPNLKPELSQSIEGGVQVFVSNKFTATLDYFSRNIKDVITYGGNGYANIDKQKDHGAEAELVYTPDDKLSLKVSYTFVDGKISTKTFTGKDTSYNNLLRKPKHSFVFNAGYQFTKNLFASVSLQTVGERKDTYFDPQTFESSIVTLDAFSLINFYTEYKIVKSHIRIFTDLRNLTNKKDYYEVYGYSVQGFTFNGGVRFNF